MKDLDRERLVEVKAWVAKEIERIEIRQANAPLWSDFQSSAGDLMMKRIPDIMAGPQTVFRNSVLKLESNLRDSDERQGKAEEGRQRRLAQARARTNVLRGCLEALSRTASTPSFRSTTCIENVSTD